jgi:hypothetical protein
MSPVTQQLSQDARTRIDREVAKYPPTRNSRP